MAHHTGKAAPCDSCAPHQLRRAFQRIALIEVGRPLRGRHFGHAPKKPLRRPRPHQQITVRPVSNKGGAAAQSAFALRIHVVEMFRHRLGQRRRSFGSRGRARSAAAPAGRWRTPRSISACAKSPGRCRGHNESRGPGAHSRGRAAGSTCRTPTAAPARARRWYRLPLPSRRRRLPRSHSRCSGRSPGF